MTRPSVLVCGSLLLAATILQGGGLTGYVLDPNWYAQRTEGFEVGVGYYEYAVNATGTTTSLAPVWGADDTDVFGQYDMSRLAAGVYNVASWDVWWRSAYAFEVAVDDAAELSRADLRLRATMWGYPAFWDEAGYYEFGQTFVATGPISMIYLRCPFNTDYTLTVHAQGPSGVQIGEARTFRGGDQRPVYGYGEMPTQAGEVYYARIRTRSPNIDGVIMQMEPRPDFSDPMPGGCLYLGDASGVTAYPNRDLGLIIMSDDDGLLTNMFTRQNGGSLSGSSIGQTFIARGSSLISAAFWLADPAAPVYEVQLYEAGPEGESVGPAVRGRPARVTADPEMMVIWGPLDCPLVPGETYYIEVTRVGGGGLQSVLTHTANPYAYGQAYRNGAAVSGVDLGATLMEERAPFEAGQPQVEIGPGPEVEEAERGSSSLVVRWVTDVPADSRVEYAAGNPPYDSEIYDAEPVLNHSIELTGLRGHTPYHFRVSSASPGRVTTVSRDVVVCTRPGTAPNLLLNPGFEEGSGPSPRSTIPGWSTSGSLDMKLSDGTWFWGLEPHGGQWLFQGAVNGGDSDAYLYQRVLVTPGESYTFSAWVTTWHRENSTWKYDVWNEQGRLIHMRLGVDARGGTNPGSPSVQWTPRLYSHRHYSNPSQTATASRSAMTVFIRMEGRGGEWQLYGVDDVVLTETSRSAPRFTGIEALTEGGVELEIEAEPNRTTYLETATNLNAWLPWTNYVSPERVFRITAPPLGRNRYYRVWTD